MKFDTYETHGFYDEMFEAGGRPRPRAEALARRLMALSDGGLKRIVGCPLGIPGHTALCSLHRLLDDAMAAIEAATAKPAPPPEPGKPTPPTPPIPKVKPTKLQVRSGDTAITERAARATRSTSRLSAWAE